MIHFQQFRSLSEVRNFAIIGVEPTELVLPDGEEVLGCLGDYRVYPREECDDYGHTYTVADVDRLIADLEEAL